MIVQMLSPIMARVSVSSNTGSVMLVMSDQTGSEVHLRFSDESKASGFWLALARELTEVYDEKIAAKIEEAKG